MSALIVGDGVAGITAATWLSRYEADFRWFGSDRWGGILNEVFNPIIDMPGMHYPDGPATVRGLAEWDGGSLPRPEVQRVVSVSRRDDGFIVRTDDDELEVQQLLLCTGTRRRKLGIDGEDEDWVVMSTAKNPDIFVDRRVVMIGGGDAGVEGALNALDSGASSVTVVTRSDLRAQRHFVSRMLAEPAITWWPKRTSPVRFRSTADQHFVDLDDGDSIECDVVVVRIGVVPLLPSIEPMPRTDAHGFLVVDDRGQSSIPGLFAAGDVTSTPLRSIATSMGDGTRAARTIAELQGIWSPYG